MSRRSRIGFSVDETNRLLIARYIGDISGADINLQLMHHASRLHAPWQYDHIIDTRRHDGTVLARDTEQLAKRWAFMAQGRDAGRMTAMVTQDALIRARQSQRSVIFPGRIMQVFDNFDEALEWIRAARGHVVATPVETFAEQPMTKSA